MTAEYMTPGATLAATAPLPSESVIANTAPTAIMSVFEHQRLQQHDFAQSTDFAWLLAQELSVFSIKRQRGQWQLKVGHYIGIILLPSGITLEILPKPVAETTKPSGTASARSAAEVMQTRTWVQRMLTDLTQRSRVNTSKPPHSQHFGQLSAQLAPLSQQTPPLSQWLVQQFCQRLVHYQPTEHYEVHTQNHPTLQGKLLIKQQLQRNCHQPHKFICEVSRRSAEMLSNRVIKSALLLLMPLSSSAAVSSTHSLPLAPILTNHMQRWRPISTLSTHERQHLDALYARAVQQLETQPMIKQQQLVAKQLLDLSYWLLQMQQRNIPTGNSIQQHAAPIHARTQLRLCVLINMNQAFEQWASLCVAAQFAQYDDDGPRYHTLYQPRDVWLQDGAGQTYLSIQPDVLIYRTEVHDSEYVHDANACDRDQEQETSRQQTRHACHCSHVIDIKWKHLPKPTAISASDAYQLISYAQAYQAQDAWLVYPVTDSKSIPIALQSPTQNLAGNHTALWLMPFNVLTGTLNSVTA